MSILGKQVLYVLGEGPYNGYSRPAFVVREWDGMDPPLVNLQVLTDSDGVYNDSLPPLMWKTSVKYDADGAKFTYHFLEDA